MVPGTIILRRVFHSGGGSRYPKMLIILLIRKRSGSDDKKEAKLSIWQSTCIDIVITYKLYGYHNVVERGSV